MAILSKGCGNHIEMKSSQSMDKDNMLVGVTSYEVFTAFGINREVYQDSPSLDTAIYESALMLQIYGKIIEPQSHKDYELIIEVDGSVHDPDDFNSVIGDWSSYSAENNIRRQMYPKIIGTIDRAKKGVFNSFIVMPINTLLVFMEILAAKKNLKLVIEAQKKRGARFVSRLEVKSEFYAN